MPSDIATELHQRSVAAMITPGEDAVVAQMEEKGPEQVALLMQSGNWPTHLNAVATRWLKEKHQESERRRDASQAEMAVAASRDAVAAERAASAAERAATAAERQASFAQSANIRATIALIISTVSIIIQVVAVIIGFLSVRHP